MRGRGDYDPADCFLCRREADGEPYPFYAGFCIDFQQTRQFWSNTIRTRATYRDLKRYHVTVCDDCASQTRLKYHLPGLIGWGTATVACLVGGLVCLVLQVAGEQTIYLLGVLGLFGVLSAILAGVAALSLVFPGQSPAVTIKVLEWVKTERSFRDKGDSFFGPEEYKVLFKDDTEGTLTAEELLARDRNGGGESRRPRKKARKIKATKDCLSCGQAIPTYAHACPHCKSILE